MKSRHILMTMVSTFVPPTPTSDVGLVGSGALSPVVLESNIPGEGAMSAAVFNSLIKVALTMDMRTPLNMRMTKLLGLTTGNEVILTKQLGIRDGDNLHGFIVSTKPNTDDVILVNQTSTVMDIYLTDSSRCLRTAATLQRDSDQPKLVCNELAAVGYGHELYVWTLLSEIARL